MALPAQVTVELRSAQEQYLLGEPVVMIVEISNQSGQPVELGKEPDWLTFAVEMRNGAPVAQPGKLALPGPFRLESAQLGRVRLDLEPAFRLDKLGNYLVAASLKVPGWAEPVSSGTTSFTIIRGTVLWEQEFGMPADGLTPATHRAPEVRKYTLLQANTVKQLRLYVRVSDPATDKIYATFPVGALVSFGRPERQIDRYSNLHILHQNGARTFNYVVVNPSGRLGLRETYEVTTSRPHLRADADGKVFVSGGQRRPSATDLPPPEPSSPANTNATATPNVASPNN
ncbi:hypothetical protein NXS98_02870 [Fontisphaera persica]|uniref:hypothetical protein n=1 Tax=Fontisphaera persica TaxID=2974023 RepID=UPI0024C0B6FD|nr:hypothetical protein [Fontisphaera persica]WCJ60084.1 hypothetical protein NXS98_02870 [Fontisphaera persica]